MRDYHINIFYSEDDDGYIADIPDLEACSAFGETPDEALREVQQAKKLYGWRLHEQRASLSRRQNIAQSYIRWRQLDNTEHIDEPGPNNGVQCLDGTT